MERDKRLVFDTIPEKFDKWRVKYNPELFDYLIKTTGLGKGKSCLEIGPGTGQASDFAIKSGCDYLAIELGEHLAAKMKEKYSSYPNFNIVNADFETYDFGDKKFDFIFSAATIQWIKEDIAYTRVFDLLKEGGYLAMCFMRSEYQSDNPALYDEIQKVYDKYFVTNQPYDQKFNYMGGEKYGLTFMEEKSFPGRREYNADEHNEYIGTHSTHIALKEEYKEPFFGGIRDAIIKHGNKIVFNDNYVVYLYKKNVSETRINGNLYEKYKGKQAYASKNYTPTSGEVAAMFVVMIVAALVIALAFAVLFMPVSLSIKIIVLIVATLLFIGIIVGFLLVVILRHHKQDPAQMHYYDVDYEYNAITGTEKNNTKEISKEEFWGKKNDD